MEEVRKYQGLKFSQSLVKDGKVAIDEMEAVLILLPQNMNERIYYNIRCLTSGNILLTQGYSDEKINQTNKPITIKH